MRKSVPPRGRPILVSSLSFSPHCRPSRTLTSEYTAVTALRPEPGCFHTVIAAGPDGRLGPRLGVWRLGDMAPCTLIVVTTRVVPNGSADGGHGGCSGGVGGGGRAAGGWRCQGTGRGGGRRPGGRDYRAGQEGVRLGCPVGGRAGAGTG